MALQTTSVPYTEKTSRARRRRGSRLAFGAIRQRAAFTLGAVLPAITLVGCAEHAPASSEPSAPPVHAEPAVLTSWVPTSVATAEILPARESLLRAEISGSVVAVSLDAGDRVREGQVLLRLDVLRTSSAVASAGATVAQNRARFEQAQRELERTERLVKVGGLADQDLDEARNEFRVASAVLDASRADARLARRGLSEAVIRAPFAGTVVERYVELGEFVAPGDQLVCIADTSALRARVLLDPREVLGLEPGANVFVEAFARPSEVFAGEVARVGDVIDPDTRRLPVEIELTDTQGRLLPGLVARFKVETGPAEQTVTLPARSIFERFGSKHVYIIEDGIAHRREVAIGRVRGGRAEVRDGIRQGEWVIVDGLSRVVDGTPVRQIPAQRTNASEPAAESDQPLPAGGEEP